MPLFQAQLETSQSDSVILRRQVEALQSEAKALREQVGLQTSVADSCFWV